MTIFDSITLGAVQGITEFLPVSSSGHLQLAKELLGVTIADNLTFDVALHAGTVLSTVVVLWREIWQLLRGVLDFRELNDSHRFVLQILLSMIPVLIVGLTCRGYIEAILTSPYNILVVGVMLLLTALLLLFAHRTPASRGAGQKITYRDAIIIGVAQAAAVMPGLSRSGATIATGILLGRDRQSVAQFSFLMVLVPIVGSTLLDLIKGGGAIAIEGVSTSCLAAGFTSSFVVGAVACRAMLEIVKRGKLLYFAIYCAVVGAISVATYLF